MRVWIGHLAAPRRLIATGSCLGALAGAVGLLVIGASSFAYALLALCVIAMVAPAVVLGRLEKRGVRD
jgi:hypothetical protein